jgi:capsular exopolysaccharide synthesis family protein
MSRIFDALQQAKLEGDGLDFPLLSSLPAESPSAVEPEIEARDFVRPETGQFRCVQISKSPDSRLVCLTDQASLAAEKFRFLGVRLRRLRQTRSISKLLVTSTVPEEGKTTVSANLALSLALRRQQKVLLLEGDLRRPALIERFGLRNLPGLSEWLLGDEDANTSIHHLEEAGLWFLPAGAAPANPLELMQSDRLGEVMDQLTELFDWIVIDSPPVVPLADTSVWMRFCDGILMVAREGTTQKRMLQRGLQELEQAKLLGVVMNGFTNMDNDSYYQRYSPPLRKPGSQMRIEDPDLV